ncbi:hypothetical protein J6590_103735 [Homalodisca vitripennis]|nr:hypothetical protein J6590_103735 [Homalodisca vitripennis]
MVNWRQQPMTALGYSHCTKGKVNWRQRPIEALGYTHCTKGKVNWRQRPMEALGYTHCTKGKVNWRQRPIEALGYTHCTKDMVNWRQRPMTALGYTHCTKVMIFVRSKSIATPRDQEEYNTNIEPTKLQLSRIYLAHRQTDGLRDDKNRYKNIKHFFNSVDRRTTTSTASKMSFRESIGSSEQINYGRLTFTDSS